MKKLIFLLLIIQSANAQVLVKSLADLKLRKGTDEGYIKLRGRTQLNDKPGTYFWDATSTSPGNDSTIVAVTNVPVGRWIREVGGGGGGGTTTIINNTTTVSGTNSTFVYSTTATTVAELARVYNAAQSNSTIVLMPGTYAFSALFSTTFNGKSNIRIVGNKNVTFSFSGATDRWLIYGSDNSLTIDGINFVCTSNTGNTTATGQGLLDMNEQGVHTDPLIINCSFTAPNCLRNGISINTYSALADGGNGAQGGLIRLKLRDDIFTDLGRMGLEALNHAWSDSQLYVLIKGVDIQGCEFIRTGLVPEANGITYNGQACSISGRATDFRFIGNGVMDAVLYALEIVGTNGVVVTGNTFNYTTKSAVQVSLADGYGNGADATQNILISANYIRSKSRPINARGASNVTVSDNVMLCDQVDNSNLSSVYFQKCTGVTLTGGSVTTGSFNPIRIDDCKDVVINIPRITGNNTNNYALVSIYGGSGYTGAGSSNFRIGLVGSIYRKSSGVITTASQMYETIGGANVTNVTTF